MIQAFCRWMLFDVMGWQSHVTEAHPDKFIIALVCSDIEYGSQHLDLVFRSLNYEWPVLIMCDIKPGLTVKIDTANVFVCIVKIEFGIGVNPDFSSVRKIGVGSLTFGCLDG